MASIRQRIASWIAGKPAATPGRRAYAAARTTRLTNGLGSSGNTSADAELNLSLTQLRARSRQMVRDSAYAKRAKVVIVNNIIGSGVGMQAQVKSTRSEMRADVNESIEEAFCEWSTAEQCHTGGKMHFSDFERAAMGQVFEAGEILIRKHYFGTGKVPLSLEMIEPERLAHNMVDPGAVSPQGEVRMGVEVNEFGRPLAYWIRRNHPGDLRTHSTSDRFERVPASDIFHLHIVDRWPQVRGEPWMHTGLRKIDDMNEATAGELAAVRASSAYFGTITTPEATNPLADDEEADGTPVMDIEPLSIQQLQPGEEFNFHAPNRPNAGLDAFLRHMLREMAAGVGVSYESISRDYSQSNYSSSRLALMEDRDLYKALQLWWIRNFRIPLHKVWLRQAVLAGAVQGVPVAQYASDPLKFEAVRFKPRGWGWIDPTKEVTAYKEAIKAGLTSTSDVIAQTADGRDIEDVVEALKRDHELFEAAGITVDTDIDAQMEADAAKAAPAPAAEPADPEDPEDSPARVLSPAPKGLQ